MPILLKFIIPRLAGQMIGFFQRLPVPLLMLILGLCAGAGSIGYLWWIQPSCEDQAIRELLTAEQEAREREAEINRIHIAKIKQLQKQLRTLSANVETVVPDKPDCDFSRGAVSLLNEARTGMPDPTGDTTGAATSPSTVTQQTATKRWIEDALQCREQREQLLQLIEWHRGQSK